MTAKPNTESDKSIDEILEKLTCSYHILDEEDCTGCHTTEALYSLLMDVIPEKVGARWGSENAETYRAYQKGYNKAIDDTTAKLNKLFNKEEIDEQRPNT